MSSPAAAAALARTVLSPTALGFVPVAVRFQLFDILADLDRPASGQDVLTAFQNLTNDKTKDVPCLLLIQDTLYAMSGLGFVDFAGEDLYRANAITKHLAATPSAKHGAVHAATEHLLAGAFLMRKLEAENFQYPFKERETPFQFAYKSMGQEELAKEHTYSIMAAQGRMDSFNHFMVGRWVKASTDPDRVRALGYDMESVLNEAQASSTPLTTVDIGGGRGQMLLDFKAAFPQLQTSDLIVQEFNADITDTPGVTLATWNYKDESPQPIKGALVYHLANILHNLSDLEAVRLLKKMSEAMAPHSRLLIHEFAKNANYGMMNAAMIALYAGRERSLAEWHQMADLAGLRVTFEAYPPFGKGLVEMRKLESSV